MLAPLGVASPTRAAERSIAVTDGAFGPAMLTIAVGDTVTWTNTDDSPHTVTAEGGAFDSGNLNEGSSFSFTFTEPGTNTYVCSYHDEMRATIVVEPASAGAAAWLAPLLIGLGLVAFAFGLFPVRPTPVARERRVAGWRR